MVTITVPPSGHQQVDDKRTSVSMAPVSAAAAAAAAAAEDEDLKHISDAWLDSRGLAADIFRRSAAH